ncbi:hypothetical protein C8R46DRAFT_469700 [Mycena filopes]|nr:hypothetical protein C8R46DRAFT_469700 [Mycena filopes]
MHRCLQIHEILDMIVGGLNPQAFRDSATLAALARTAKLFHDPALDLLWKTQDTPANLLRCMPSDFFTLDSNGDERTLRLLRAITASDWERPSAYMNRVKHFSFLLSRSMSVSDVLSTLATCLPRDCFFPKLTSIVWCRSDDSDFQYIRLFLGPDVTSVRVYCDHSPHQLSFLSLLGRKNGGLKNVTLHMHGSSELDASVSNTVSTFVCGQHSLESLLICAVNPAALDHLAQLSTLRSLDIDTHSLAPSTFLPPTSPTFLNLTSLNLRTASTEQATTFLDMVANSALASLTVSFRASPEAADVQRFSSALGQTCHSSRLSLTSCTLHIPMTTEFNVKMNLFDNLACFSQLTEVVIFTRCGFELDDGAVNRLTRAWPLLQELHLVQSSPSSLATTPTLLCLPMVAQNCPLLEELTLTLSARAIPPQSPALTQTALRALDVGHSPITLPLPVARFLSAIFPNLQSVSTAWEDEDDPDGEENDTESMVFHRRWKEVETFVPVLVAVREEARLLPR